MGCGGLVRRPWANVSADKRYPNSSCASGTGSGINGRRLTRTKITARKITQIARLFLAANCAHVRSIGPKASSPRCGAHQATTRNAKRSKASACGTWIGDWKRSKNADVAIIIDSGSQRLFYCTLEPAVSGIWYSSIVFPICSTGLY